MKEFKDKVIVVTGGGRGIGRAMAIEGAKRGMKCVINDIDGPAARSVVEEIKAMGAEAVAQEADISLYENIEALLKLTLDTFGRVDILCNNAGCAVSGPIWELPKQDIDWIAELNFLSHIYGMKVFIPQMIKQGTPCEIINTESTAGLMTSGNATMYHCTKAAGVAASESVYMAMKNRGYPITIHCLELSEQDENGDWYDYREDHGYDAYVVTCSWTYKENSVMDLSKFAKSINLAVINRSGRFEIVEASEKTINARTGSEENTTAETSEDTETASATETEYE